MWWAYRLVGLGALLPTVGIYIRQKGIGADEAALLGFLAPFIGFFARAAVPILADRIGFHKFVRCSSQFEITTE